MHSRKLKSILKINIIHHSLIDSSIQQSLIFYISGDYLQTSAKICKSDHVFMSKKDCFNYGPIVFTFQYSRNAKFLDITCKILTGLLSPSPSIIYIS